jgi:acyl-CoA thioester hydrolase
VTELSDVQGELAAEITVDGSWIDIEKRKSVTPAKDILELFNSFPRAEEFVWLPEKRSS